MSRANRLADHASATSSAGRSKTQPRGKTARPQSPKKCGLAFTFQLLIFDRSRPFRTAGSIEIWQQQTIFAAEWR
jgi:hypothetical protein